jgi:hypothetical protein
MWPDRSSILDQAQAALPKTKISIAAAGDVISF